eukprot:14230125-Alexandrium_andersonii.AAC.1
MADLLDLEAGAPRADASLPAPVAPVLPPFWTPTVADRSWAARCRRLRAARLQRCRNCQGG